MRGKQERDPRPVPGRIRQGAPGGGFVEQDGEIQYRISAYHKMAPFLVSIPSDTDLWMFLASGGGLTAGRVDAEGSLFPYLTVDQLHDAHFHTGPVTLVRLERKNQAPVLWEPLTAAGDFHGDIERNLTKNVAGNHITFEEIHHGLGLLFRYRWAACNRFGWVRTATLVNVNHEPVQVDLLDGLRNILPWGAPLPLYQQASNLVDAYKKSEVDEETGLGIFSLTAGITDRAEALEILRANTAWCCGLDDFRVHLSLDCLTKFRNGEVLPAQRVLNGTRGNYLVSSHLALAPEESACWHIAGDTGLDHGKMAALRQVILAERQSPGSVEIALKQAGENLNRYVAAADGLQLTARTASWAHHFANVLFNCMRGGVFADQDRIPVGDFADFLAVRNKEVAARHRDLVASLPDPVTVSELSERVAATSDADLVRLSLEYLPLHFGRRHGDPSRPWNHFVIRVRNSAGDPVLSYEGNWRDIFQNWEALATAYPGFLPNMVAKFVNASTVDGFNPYRINREGVEWETPAADDPWSNIGYWGDHQIIYLLKLLELWHRHDPDGITGMLGESVFSYAEVPYRLRPYGDILRDPADTITFDEALDRRIQQRVIQRGTDGKLLNDREGRIQHVNLLEKLLVPVLSKLSNLVLDGGIWMNTQRPEWNDANNALAGGGISVVTLGYLRRYLAFLAGLLEQSGDREYAVSTEVVDWLDNIARALASEKALLNQRSLDPQDRKRLLDKLGEAFSDYRQGVYDRGFTGRRDLGTHQAAAFCRTALTFVDWGLAANRRPDGLFHAYNMLHISGDAKGAEVAALPVMLEGQVAALGSGVLGSVESLEILRGLFASDLYRPDQHSFQLYPARELPGFMARGRVAESAAMAIPLLKDMLQKQDQSLLLRDVEGICRFHPDFSNAAGLAAALDRLADQEPWSKAVARDRAAVLALYEDTFGHRSYTGRSGAMYGYEGLGCIYWHMVAKLLLAVQETYLRGRREHWPQDEVHELARMYFRIRAGLGYEKSVTEFGAFPTDPYSHTPAGGGAKQPGMTGQVKEEILTRRGELGIRVENGALHFQPALLRPDEFLIQPADFHHVDPAGQTHIMPLAAGSLAFTLCQVPVVYVLDDAEASLTVEYADGSSWVAAGNTLPPAIAREVFIRSGRIKAMRVVVPKNSLSVVSAGGEG